MTCRAIRNGINGIGRHSAPKYFCIAFLQECEGTGLRGLYRFVSGKACALFQSDRPIHIEHVPQ
jgi:hypothetical protein